MGKGIQHDSLHPTLVSSKVLGGKNIREGIHWCEDKGESFSHIWLFSLHVCIGRKKTKLEPSNMKGLFMDCSETSKACRVYISEYRKIVVSGDVNFEE